MIYAFKTKWVIIGFLFFTGVFALGLIWKFTGYGGIADVLTAK